MCFLGSFAYSAGLTASMKLFKKDVAMVNQIFLDEQNENTKSIKKLYDDEKDDDDNKVTSSDKFKI